MHSKTLLENILQLHRGYDLPEREREDGNVPIISSSGYSGTHNKYKCDGENVITGRYGTIGEVFFHDGECWPLNTALYVSDFKGNVPRYICYLLKYVLKLSIDGKDKSTVPGVDRNVLHKMNVPFCEDINEQKRTIAILEQIDRKIELNRKINDNLQQMAYAKYMHMFYGKKPNAKLGDIIVEQPKSTIQVGDAKEASGTIPFFTSGEAILKWPEALVNGRNCYLNTGGNADVKFYVGKSAYSTDTWCITAENDIADYLYLLLDSIRTELNLKFFQGTGLKHLQKPLLKDRPIYIPSQNELSEFNVDVQPWLSMISDNIRESEELKSLRDWLLPMLMNGQATISD